MSWIFFKLLDWLLNKFLDIIFEQLDKRLDLYFDPRVSIEPKKLLFEKQADWYKEKSFVFYNKRDVFIYAVYILLEDSIGDLKETTLEYKKFKPITKHTIWDVEISYDFIKFVWRNQRGNSIFLLKMHEVPPSSNIKFTIGSNESHNIKIKIIQYALEQKDEILKTPFKSSAPYYVPKRVGDITWDLSFLVKKK